MKLPAPPRAVLLVYNNKVHNIAAITVTFAGCWSTFFDVFLPFFWSQELMISQKDASTARALEPENPKAWWRGCKNGGFLYWKWLFLCFKIEILDIRYFIYQKHVTVVEVQMAYMCARRIQVYSVSTIRRGNSNKSATSKLNTKNTAWNQTLNKKQTKQKIHKGKHVQCKMQNKWWGKWHKRANMLNLFRWKSHVHTTAYVIILTQLDNMKHQWV